MNVLHPLGRQDASEAYASDSVYPGEVLRRMSSEERQLSSSDSFLCQRQTARGISQMVALCSRV